MHLRICQTICPDSNLYTHLYIIYFTININLGNSVVSREAKGRRILQKTMDFMPINKEKYLYKMIKNCHNRAQECEKQ